MKDFTQAKQIALNRLDQLPPHRITQVLDFIDFLLERPTFEPIKPEISQGNLRDLLDCVGIWDFEANELNEILSDIEQSRLMELEHQHDELSD